MKKLYFNTFLSILVLFLLTLGINVKALDGVAKVGNTEYSSLQDAVDASNGATVYLLQDLTETPYLDSSDVVLDLGGNTLTVSGYYGLAPYYNLTVKNGTIKNNDSGSFGVSLFEYSGLTLESDAKIVAAYGVGTRVFSEEGPITAVIKGEIESSTMGIYVGGVNSSVTVAESAKISAKDGIAIYRKSCDVTINGKVTGTNTAVTISGNLADTSDPTTINIGETASLNSNAVALYLAGYGKTTIADGAKLTADITALEIRAGELTINGGEFTSNYEGEISVRATSGSSTYGAALAIAQHSTKLPIKVTVNGGTFNGVAAVYESNPLQNSNASDDIELTITDGTFNATGDTAVYSEDEEEFISGGVYNTDVSSDYVVKDKIEYRIDDETVVVGEPVTKVVSKLLNKEAVSASDLALIEEALPSGYSIGAYYDVVYGSFRPSPDNSLIDAMEEASSELKVVLTLGDDFPSKDSDVTRTYKVIRVHDGEAEVLDATDNGDGTVSCMSDKFSTYAVIYQDTANVQKKETTSITNPKTGDKIILFAIIALIGFGGSTITIKKLANR